MDAIWTRLPDDLVFKIIGNLDDIDTRLAFGIPPKKLRLNKNFEFRNEIVYDPISKTLFQFENQIIFVRKNINISTIRPGPLYIFNMEWDEYDLIIHVGRYTFGPMLCSKHVVTNKKVKFVRRYGPRDMGQITGRIGA